MIAASAVDLAFAVSVVASVDLDFQITRVYNQRSSYQFPSQSSLNSKRPSTYRIGRQHASPVLSRRVDSDHPQAVRLGQKLQRFPRIVGKEHYFKHLP